MERSIGVAINSCNKFADDVISLTLGQSREQKIPKFSRKVSSVSSTHAVSGQKVRGEGNNG